MASVATSQTNPMVAREQLQRGRASAVSRDGVIGDDDLRQPGFSGDNALDDIKYEA